jgi:hypothetical protein
MKSDTMMQRVSQILAVGTFILCLGVPLITWRLLRTKDVESEEFEKAYGPLVKDVTFKTIISKYWNLLNLLRWALITLILVVSKDYSCFQIQLNLALSLIWQILIISGRPY